VNRDQTVLLDIIHACRWILDFTRDVSDFDAFLRDAKTRSAVLYQILVIGEAVKRLSQDFRQRHEHIPWALIAGMRDHIIHGYDVIDWEEVWRTLQGDIPWLLRQLEMLLAE